MHDRLQDNAPRTSIPNIVSDIWIHHTKQWDTQKIELFFGPQSVQVVTKIQIINHHHDDYLCWDTSISGTCIAKEAYLMLANQNPAPINNQGIRALPQPILHILNIIWRNSLLQPRLKTFTWRLLRQALATGQRAGRFSQHIDEKCACCGNLETDNHLFFSCHFARAVWFAGTPSIKTDLLPQGPQGVQQEVSSLITPTTSMQEIQRLITTMWFLWKARNDHMSFMLLRQTSISHTLSHKCCKINLLLPPSHKIQHHHTTTRYHLFQEQDAMWMQQSHQTHRGRTQDKLALEF